MDYPVRDLAEPDIARATHPLFQHLLDTYASETNKTASVWRELRDNQLEFRPHPKSSTVREILKHQILSERRFFAEFIGLPEPPVTGLLPAGETPPVERERIWVFWRRVLHSAHHRAQISVFLRLLQARVPPTYGPTADVSVSGADPTRTIASADRRGPSPGPRG